MSHGGLLPRSSMPCPFAAGSALGSVFGSVFGSVLGSVFGSVLGSVFGSVLGSLSTFTTCVLTVFGSLTSLGSLTSVRTAGVGTAATDDDDDELPVFSSVTEIRSALPPVNTIGRVTET